MALKIKIPGGSGGMPPDASFPVPTRSLGQMRKLLRGPGQATYDFDGVRPGLLVVKKGWPAGQTLPSLASLLFAHAIKHMLCFGTSFLCAEKGGKDAGSSAGYLDIRSLALKTSPLSRTPGIVCRSVARGRKRILATFAAYSVAI